MTKSVKVLFDVAGLGHDVNADRVSAPIEAPGPLQCETIQDGGALIVVNSDDPSKHVKSDHFVRIEQ